MQGKAGLHQGQGGAVRLQAEKCGRSAVICVLPDRSSIVQMTINRQEHTLMIVHVCYGQITALLHVILKATRS